MFFMSLTDIHSSAKIKDFNTTKLERLSSF